MSGPTEKAGLVDGSGVLVVEERLLAAAQDQVEVAVGIEVREPRLGEGERRDPAGIEDLIVLLPVLGLRGECSQGQEEAESEGAGEGTHAVTSVLRGLRSRRSGPVRERTHDTPVGGDRQGVAVGTPRARSAGPSVRLGRVSPLCQPSPTGPGYTERKFLSGPSGPARIRFGCPHSRPESRP